MILTDYCITPSGNLAVTLDLGDRRTGRILLTRRMVWLRMRQHTRNALRTSPDHPNSIQGHTELAEGYAALLAFMDRELEARARSSELAHRIQWDPSTGCLVLRVDGVVHVQIGHEIVGEGGRM